jgi:ATP-binding cassette subfamily A (ABC1) protein 3
VKNLKFDVEKNKCFGLLGVNGAGKSTTFRMLTKYLFFDKGKISISAGAEPTSISKAEYSEKIGYCPQEDCLNYYLTGKELLYVIANIKGYSNEAADKIIKALLDRFDLNKYADKPCLEYSGGNKRKLNCCLAFLGSPSVILLDEPTSGVDPASRRNFWNTFLHFKKHQETSFLLCSHSTLKENYTNIEDYIISDISLEDIFLSVAEENDHSGSALVSLFEIKLIISARI